VAGDSMNREFTINSYREQITAVLDAVVIHTPLTYSWFGKSSPQLAPSVKRALTPETSHGYLHFSLQSHLYKYFYCKGRAMPEASVSVNHNTTSMPFVQRLSEANCGSGCRQEGWEVRAVRDNGAIIVHKNGLELTVHHGDCILSQPDDMAPGAKLGLLVPRELLGLSPGYYMALGDVELKVEDAQVLVRLYWNLTAEGALTFMRSASARLNQTHVAFSLKALNDPTEYSRGDAVVLYIRKDDYSTVAKIAEEIYPEVAAWLQDWIPVFTKRRTGGRSRSRQ